MMASAVSSVPEGKRPMSRIPVTGERGRLDEPGLRMRGGCHHADAVDVREPAKCRLLVPHPVLRTYDGQLLAAGRRQCV